MPASRPSARPYARPHAPSRALSRGLRLPAATVLAAMLMAAPPAAAEDPAANRLFVEAIQILNTAAPGEPGRAEAVAGALERFDRIVAEHPGSGLAVQIVTGQPIGSVDVAALRAEGARLEAILADTPPAAPGVVTPVGSTALLPQTPGEFQTCATTLDCLLPAAHALLTRWQGDDDAWNDHFNLDIYAAIARALAATGQAGPLATHLAGFDRYVAERGKSYALGSILREMTRAFGPGETARMLAAQMPGWKTDLAAPLGDELDHVVMVSLLATARYTGGDAVARRDALIAACRAHPALAPAAEMATAQIAQFEASPLPAASALRETSDMRRLVNQPTRYAVMGNPAALPMILDEIERRVDAQPRPWDLEEKGWRAGEVATPLAGHGRVEAAIAYTRAADQGPANQNQRILGEMALFLREPDFTEAVRVLAEKVPPPGEGSETSTGYYLTMMLDLRAAEEAADG